MIEEWAIGHNDAFSIVAFYLSTSPKLAISFERVIKASGANYLINSFTLYSCYFLNGLNTPITAKVLIFKFRAYLIVFLIYSSLIGSISFPS